MVGRYKRSFNSFFLKCQITVGLCQDVTTKWSHKHQRQGWQHPGKSAKRLNPQIDSGQSSEQSSGHCCLQWEYKHTLLPDQSIGYVCFQLICPLFKRSKSVTVPVNSSTWSTWLWLWRGHILHQATKQKRQSNPNQIILPLYNRTPNPAFVLGDNKVGNWTQKNQWHWNNHLIFSDYSCSSECKAWTECGFSQMQTKELASQT